MNRTHILAAVLLVAVGVVVCIGAYYIYQYTLQPNIQVTSVYVDDLDKGPQTINWRELTRVSGKVSFNYPVVLTGEYVAVFSNAFSQSDRSINFTYTTHWPDYLWSNFTLSPGEIKTVQIHVNSGQQLGGDFWVAGGTSNDVDFQIIAYTCTENVTFSFSLVNKGTADGYAEVAFTVDGASAWSNKYFVPAGMTLPIYGSVSVENCVAHHFDIVVQKQYKP